MSYGNVVPAHVLIVSCENGFGVDITFIVEGEQVQKTYIANTLEQAMSFVKKAFTGGVINE